MLIAAVIGCKGSSDLIISGIIGPSSVPDDTSVEFSVDVQGDTGLAYLWSIDPPHAGTFDDPTSLTTTFNSAVVTRDTQATIAVVVTSGKSGPVIREFDIVVTEHGLVVGEIEGPTHVNDDSTVHYSISALGDHGITYKWACGLPIYVTFTEQFLPETGFVIEEIPAMIDFEYVIKTSIFVTVDSPYSDPVTRSMEVWIMATDPIQNPAGML